MARVHNYLCKMTNGGFMYDCHCDDPEYIEELIKNDVKYWA